MRKAWMAVAVSLALGACDIPKFTADSTSKVLVRAQPSLQMESSYEMAAKALPGTLKTVEGFWVVSPDNPTFLAMLTEGYCQYGSGFVDDDWEIALIEKDFDRVAELDEHATKVYIRCLNYALKQLGKSYQEDLFGSEEVVAARLARAGKGQRTALMWAAVALASAINHNKDRVEMVGYLETAKAMLRRVVEIDEKYGAPKNKIHAALPHVALAMAATGLSQALGGDPEYAEKEFQKAIELTDGKFLLAMVLEARWVQYRKNDRKAFHDNLVKVLETDPSIWPEQRLANEIALRRARRYLKQEKELFP
jgi:tetratricopeptide (TPR) repeat protein